MTNSPFAIRAVQLDLARQMEPLSFIKEFCDFIAVNGFNTLVLYLEARVKTKSFPYPPENACYTADEMREVVAHAAKLGIDVIPVVSTLGHAELFLQYEALAPLAELRDGVEGRFVGSKSKQVFCPSLTDTYTFFEAYLKEMADIFPSPYFHLGCDESWDIGCCELCRQRIEEGETEADLFAAHLSRCHEIISDGLGKRMMIWDDMFEQYPEALERIPKSIVMCTWDYSNCPELPIGHFSNGVRYDFFKRYEELGFDYLFASGGAISNITRLTDYGRQYAPLGGLFTIWEMSTSFIYHLYPAIAFAGKLWSNDNRKLDTRQLFVDASRDLFDCNAPELFDALYAMSCGSEFKTRGTTARNHLACHEWGHDETGRSLASLLLHVFERYHDVIENPIGKAIIEDMQASLERVSQCFQLEDVVPSLLLKSTSYARAVEILSVIEEKIVKLAALRTAQWHRWRDGITPCNVIGQFDEILEQVRALPESDMAAGMLHVYFCLPEQTSAQTCWFSVKYEGATDFEPIESGVYKSDNIRDVFYGKVLPLAPGRKPEAIKIVTCGYGGQGFTYLRASNRHGSFVPASVTVETGQVSHPEYLLDHDRKWCFTGTQDTANSFKHSNLAREKHTLVIKLKKTGA